EHAHGSVSCARQSNDILRQIPISTAMFSCNAELELGAPRNNFLTHPCVAPYIVAITALSRTDCLFAVVTIGYNTIIKNHTIIFLSYSKIKF
ncbi:MAG: hypothetical protein WCL46_10105, partial [Chlorobium sp.]